jgi:hypothetical protein
MLLVLPLKIKKDVNVSDYGSDPSTGMAGLYRIVLFELCFFQVFSYLFQDTVELHRRQVQMVKQVVYIIS